MRGHEAEATPQGVGGVAPPAGQAKAVEAAPSAADAGATSAMLLDAREARPFEDLLSKGRGAMPERHVQLFSSWAGSGWSRSGSGQLQFKWQCYDAYCRVCLGLGLSLGMFSTRQLLRRLRNHILQALTYYCICHTLVENRTPSLGFGLVVLFQAATIFVAFLDLAGLQHKEIITVQVVSHLAGA